MPVATIRKNNRITIPAMVMASKNLHVGDEVYFEIAGVIGRDVFITHAPPTGAGDGSAVYASTSGKVETAGDD